MPYRGAGIGEVGGAGVYRIKSLGIGSYGARPDGGEALGSIGLLSAMGGCHWRVTGSDPQGTVSALPASGPAAWACMEQECPARTISGSRLPSGCGQLGIVLAALRYPHIDPRILK